MIGDLINKSVYKLFVGQPRLHRVCQFYNSFHIMYVMCPPNLSSGWLTAQGTFCSLYIWLALDAALVCPLHWSTLHSTLNCTAQTALNLTLHCKLNYFVCWSCCSTQCILHWTAHCTAHFTAHFIAHCTAPFTAHCTLHYTLHCTFHCTLECTTNYTALHTTLQRTLHCPTTHLICFLSSPFVASAVGKKLPGRKYPPDMDTGAGEK